MIALLFEKSKYAMMSFTLLRLLVDFGLVVLIWMVQLIIYPSFTAMTEESIKLWHPRYTGVISLFVIPLMFGQVGLYAQALLTECDWKTGLAALLIFVCWLSTFVKAVPLHGQIDQLPSSLADREELVLANWPRTICWSLVFVLSLWEASSK